MLAFEDFDGDLKPDGYSFKTTSFWIKIYALLINFLKMDIVEKLGNKIDVFKKFDYNPNRYG